MVFRGLWNKGITADGKVLLRFVKGRRPGYNKPIRNFIESTLLDNSLDNSSQGITEAEEIISNLTLENQAVLDSFLGTATSGVAAVKFNRKIIGAEFLKDAFIMARNR